MSGQRFRAAERPVRVHDSESLPTAATIGDQTGMAGDLRQLYRDRKNHLVGLADWIVGDRGLAEELVQDTFVRIVERPPELHDPDAIEAYVRAAVVNRSRSRVRRLVLERRHRARLQDAGAATDRVDGIEPVDRAVRDAVAALPQRQRECVVLRFYVDLTVDGIADTLGIGSGSVKTHLHRGLNRLEQLLASTNEATPADARADEIVGGHGS